MSKNRVREDTRCQEISTQRQPVSKGVRKVPLYFFFAHLLLRIGLLKILYIKMPPLSLKIFRSTIFQRDLATGELFKRQKIRSSAQIPPIVGYQKILPVFLRR